MKRRVILFAVLITFLFLVGCMDYKSYDYSEDNQEGGETNLALVDEIAQIEKELEQDVVDEDEKEVVEEVVLPELSDTPEPVSSADVQEVYVKENSLVRLAVEVRDPDDDPVTYSFTKPLDDQGKWQTAYGDAGEYLVTITATDGKLTTTKQVKIIVSRVNVRPVLESIKDITVSEGDVVTFEPKVHDPNNDPVTVEVSAPLQDGKFVTDHTSAGEYQIFVTVSDGELTTEESFTLMVRDVNIKPEITGVEDVVIKEGGTVELRPVVTDLDNDPVTLRISNPVGDTGVWETSFRDHGEYTVTIVADDGKSQVTKTVKVTVEDVNMPPEIVSVSLQS